MKTSSWIWAGAIGLVAAMGAPQVARAGDVSVHLGFGGGHCGPYFGPRYYGRGHYYGRPGGYYPGGGVVIESAPVIVERERRVVVVDRGGGASWEIVRDVQLELRRRGFYGGAIDGIAGPRTRDAIAAYQDRRGLPVTGVIDRNLLAALHLG